MTSTKTEQLQVRLTPEQKSAIKRLAAASGIDVSNYVLIRVLPQTRQRFEELLQLITEPSERRFALAELGDLLTGMAAPEFGDALERVDVRALTPLDQNYVAAMVEEAAHRKDAEPPRWVTDVAPLDRPHFTTPFQALRLAPVQGIARPIPPTECLHRFLTGCPGLMWVSQKTTAEPAR